MPRTVLIQLKEECVTESIRCAGTYLLRRDIFGEIVQSALKIHLMNYGISEIAGVSCDG